MVVTGTEILLEYPSLFRIYKNGDVERFPGTTDFAAATVDKATGVTSQDINTTNGITVRLYTPTTNKLTRKLPVLIYFHGGAFCVYSAFSPPHHSFVNSLVSQAQLVAVSINYRLAPEHPLPAAYNDCWAAIQWALTDNWLAENADLTRVFMAGESAGGNIAHRMAMWAGEAPTGGLLIEGMLLVHPFFWGSEIVGSETRDVVEREFIEELWRVVNLPGGGDIDNPWINPIVEAAPSLAGLGCRRVMVCVAEMDDLAERGRAYYEVLKGSGWEGEAWIFESEGEEHCFHLDNPGGARARELMKKLVGFINSSR